MVIFIVCITERRALFSDCVDVFIKAHEAQIYISREQELYTPSCQKLCFDICIIYLYIYIPPLEQHNINELKPKKKKAINMISSKIASTLANQRFLNWSCKYCCRKIPRKKMLDAFH